MRERRGATAETDARSLVAPTFSFSQLPANAAAATLASLGLATGDVLVVREGPAVAAAAAPAAAAPALRSAEPDWGALAAPDGMTEDEAIAAAIAASTSEAVAVAPAPAPAPAAAPTSAAEPDWGALAAPGGMDEDQALAAAIAARLAGGGCGGGGRGGPAPAAAPPACAPRPPRGEVSRGDVATLASLAPPTTNAGAPTEAPVPGGAGAVVARRVVAADNSCLFAAVAYVLAGGRAGAGQLRAAAARAVMEDPATWTEAVLGRPPAEYAAWISHPKHWGGAIELAILSRQLGAEIAAHDVATGRVDTYGHGEGRANRALLIYDGLHYDALAMAPRAGAPESSDTVSFSVADPRLPGVMEAASALVSANRAARQFTDTARFTLRCGVCGIGVVGEADAVKHAQESGHANFQEY